MGKFCESAYMLRPCYYQLIEFRRQASSLVGAGLPSFFSRRVSERVSPQQSKRAISNRPRRVAKPAILAQSSKSASESARTYRTNGSLPWAIWQVPSPCRHTKYAGECSTLNIRRWDQRLHRHADGRTLCQQRKEPATDGFVRTAKTDESANIGVFCASHHIKSD